MAAPAAPPYDPNGGIPVAQPVVMGIPQQLQMGGAQSPMDASGFKVSDDKWGGEVSITAPSGPQQYQARAHTRTPAIIQLHIRGEHHAAPAPQQQAPCKMALTF